MILTCDYCSSSYILPDAGLVNCPACGAPGSHDVENLMANSMGGRLMSYGTVSLQGSMLSSEDGGVVQIADSDGGIWLSSTA